MNFEDRVERLRVFRKMTVAEVLRSIGISAPMMSMIRARKRTPSIKSHRRLEAAEQEAGLPLTREFPIDPLTQMLLREKVETYGKQIVEVTREQMLETLDRIERDVQVIKAYMKRHP